MSEYPKALEYFEKSLKIKQKLLGEEYLATAASYNNMGIVYRSMSEYPKALEYFEKTIKIQQKLLGEEH